MSANVNVPGITRPGIGNKLIRRTIGFSSNITHADIGVVKLRKDVNAAPIQKINHAPKISEKYMPQELRVCVSAKQLLMTNFKDTTLFPRPNHAFTSSRKKGYFHNRFSFGRYCARYKTIVEGIYAISVATANNAGKAKEKAVQLSDKSAIYFRASNIKKHSIIGTRKYKTQ